jgi:hypothetical protein
MDIAKHGIEAARTNDVRITAFNLLMAPCVLTATAEWHCHWHSNNPEK